MDIPYINLKLQWQKEKKELLPLVKKILAGGEYVIGNEVDRFEKNIAKVCKRKYAVAFNSGTDALLIGLILLGVKKGDEVITPPNSYIASTTSITHLGAKPIFADVLDDQNINPSEISKKITDKTKAIMPVHLTGRICEMNEIKKISKKYKIPIIEDAAQSIGSKYHGMPAGSFGEIACFSAHPLKNLNACGDAGFLVTNNFSFYKRAKKIRNHGLEDRNRINEFGFLSRMDVLQAAILNFRIKKLNSTNKKRRKNAEFYFKNINKDFYSLINEKKYQYNTYHTFVIQTHKREKLIKYLNMKKIGTAIHYPIPIHLQKASKYLKYKKGSFPVTEQQSKKILTLPIHQNLKKNELIRIVKKLNEFAEKNER
tara:strand:+ start:283 stop:1392 length:1110 start_codon:yes stop_codon:yes gene_type:complete